MNRLVKRIKGKIRKILRDNFGFFYPLGGQTVNAVEYALGHSSGGHYYEFGLYQGYTFCRAVQKSPNLHHFGFDSFEGMPENKEGGGFTPGRFKCSYKKVVNSLLNNNAFTHREHLIKGFFKDSLTEELKLELKNFPPGVVLIDSDLYESALEVLNFMGSLFQSGTIVIFDDWHAFDENSGEQKALKDFLKANQKILFKEINEFTGRKLFRVELVNA